MDSLSINIRRKMQEMRLTPYAVEKKTGISKVTIHNILLGRVKNPSIETVHLISKALECSVSELIGASQEIEYLRKKELVKQEDKGSSTYYTAGPVMENLNAPTNRHMPKLPEDIALLISKLSKKPRIAETKEVVLALCSWREMGAEEIAFYLQRKDPRRLVRDVIKIMLEEHFLELTIPQSKKHPYQKYRAMDKSKS